MVFYFTTALLLTFFITVILTRKMIPWLKKFAGQTILEIGPRWHKSKEGTPSMGGLSFLIAITCTAGLLFALMCYKRGFSFSYPLLLSLLFAVGNALVGIVDDRAKIKKKQNEGLSPLQKILLQALFAAAYLYLLHLVGAIRTVLHLPFTDMQFDLGYAYYFFAMVLILGVVNCANLTDGIDGLASSVALVIGGAFSLYAAKIGIAALPVSVIGGCMIGATLGFLIFNFHPARVFMGDTGSLFLGALAASLAFLMDMPLIILLVGIIYVIEGCSVVLQVVYYKLTKKRLFRMAPIHHHFEKCGWGEVKIVCVFSFITLLFSLLVYFSI